MFFLLFFFFFFIYLPRFIYALIFLANDRFGIYFFFFVRLLCSVRIHCCSLLMMMVFGLIYCSAFGQLRTITANLCMRNTHNFVRAWKKEMKDKMQYTQTDTRWTHGLGADLNGVRACLLSIQFTRMQCAVRCKHTGDDREFVQTTKGRYMQNLTDRRAHIQLKM